MIRFSKRKQDFVCSLREIMMELYIINNSNDENYHTNSSRIAIFINPSEEILH